MIITAQEYRDMGFTAENNETLENCLLRASYIIAALTEGRHETALAAGGKAADYVKQAAAFQTCKLVKEEENADVEQSSSEKVSIGDYSYTTQAQTAAHDYSDSFYDMSTNTVRLLRAAGCLFGGREARI